MHLLTYFWIRSMVELPPGAGALNGPGRAEPAHSALRAKGTDGAFNPQLPRRDARWCARETPVTTRHS